MKYYQRKPHCITFRVWFDNGATRFHRFVTEETSEDACVVALEIGDLTSSIPLYPFEIQQGPRWVPYHPVEENLKPVESEGPRA